MNILYLTGHFIGPSARLENVYTMQTILGGGSDLETISLIYVSDKTLLIYRLMPKRFTDFGRQIQNVAMF